MKKQFILFVVLCTTSVLGAQNNVITYTATAKLPETTWQWSSGLHTNAFNVSKISHQYSNGSGTITFSGDVTSVGTCAFYESKGLTSITLPNSVKSIGFAAFDSCSNLATVVLGDSVISIGDYAFLGARNLESINVPNSVKSIGEYAFGGCRKLVSLNVSDSVTYIGDGAFSACPSLTSIHIPINLQEIRLNTFRWCASIRSVVIPRNVATIGETAFYDCKGLTSISCLADTPPTCANNSFDSVDRSIPLYVPIKSYNAYKSANVWKEFLNLKYSTKCKITTNSNPSDGGSVIGGGLIDIPDVTLTAIPNKHYHFTQWSDGNTDNPREIVVTQDTTFTAEFAINQYTVSISSDNPSAGIVSGSGTYDALTNVTVMAAASAVGYKWDKWSDGVTLAGRQITLTSDTTLTAYFISADEVECIEVEENNALLGTADIQIIATPNKGAQFTQWSDGNTDNPRIVTNAPGLYTAIFSNATKTSSITADQHNAIQKRIVDDQLLILRDGKAYNAQGGEL